MGKSEGAIEGTGELLQSLMGHRRILDFTLKPEPQEGFEQRTDGGLALRCS